MKQAILTLMAVAGVACADVTTFDNGTEGWSVSGRDNLSPVGGNPGANMDVEVIDVFGADIRNSTAAFTGDYRGRGNLTFTVDIQIDSINMFGTEVSRDLVIELRNYDTPNWGGFTSIYAHLGTLSSANTSDWTTFQAVLDTNAVGLPSGWFGAGDEDPNTFEPILPPGVSVQDVLSGIDEISFTTFVPGYFFGFTNFIMAVDNVGFVPAPGTGVALLGAMGLGTLRRRR